MGRPAVRPLGCPPHPGGDTDGLRLYPSQVAAGVCRWPEVHVQASMRAAVWLAASALFCGCASHRTMPILDDQGRALPDSIASLEPVELGGVEQWILIRGRDVTRPLLLKVHGGPGQAEMATVRFNGELEKEFVVVEWDQRGAGKSRAGIEPRSGMTIEQFVEDAHELTRLLLRRFHRDKLILVGHSWGSVVGLLAVQKYPADYQAFVSTGQIADFAAGQRLAYAFLREEAERRGSEKARRELDRIGPPPFTGDDAQDKRETIVKWLGEFGGLWHGPASFDRVGWMIASVEYSWPEKLAFPGAASRSFEALFAQLERVDLGAAVPRVEVPVYFAVGRHDHMAPFAVSQRYFDALVAPRKEWRWFEGSAHFPQWEEPTAFRELLAKVAADTRPGEAPSVDR